MSDQEGTSMPASTSDNDPNVSYCYMISRGTQTTSWVDTASQTDDIVESPSPSPEPTIPPEPTITLEPTIPPEPYVFANPDAMIDECIEDFALDDMDDFNSNVRLTLVHSLSHFSDMTPEERPTLPELPLHKTTIEIIGVLGVYVQRYLDNTDSRRAMDVLYCGAIAAIRLAGIDLPAELREGSACSNPYCRFIREFVDEEDLI